MTDEQIIEAIARKWFRPLDRARDPSWDSQPQDVRDGFMRKARAFWADPDRMFRALHAAHHRVLCDMGTLDRELKAARGDFL